MDATPAAEPPPVAATAVKTVAPSAAATVAAVAAAAEPVGGAWEGGRARREGRGRGARGVDLGRFGPWHLFFGLFVYVVWSVLAIV